MSWLKFKSQSSLRLVRPDLIYVDTLVKTLDVLHRAFCLLGLYNIKENPAETKPLEGKYTEKFNAMMKIYQQYEKDHNIVKVAEDWNPWLAAAD